MIKICFVGLSLQFLRVFGGSLLTGFKFRKGQITASVNILHWSQINFKMSTILFPRESGEFIARKAEHVKINDAGVKNAAEKVSYNGRNKTFFFF